MRCTPNFKQTQYSCHNYFHSTGTPCLMMDLYHFLISRILEQIKFFLHSNHSTIPNTAFLFNKTTHYFINPPPTPRLPLNKDYQTIWQYFIRSTEEDQLYICPMIPTYAKGRLQTLHFWSTEYFLSDWKETQRLMSIWPSSTTRFLVAKGYGI